MSSHDSDSESDDASGNDSYLDREADALRDHSSASEIRCPCDLFYALALEHNPILHDVPPPQHSAPIECVSFLDAMLVRGDWTIQQSIFLTSGLHPALCQFRHLHATPNGFFDVFVGEVIKRIADSPIPASISAYPPYRDSRMHHTLVSIGAADASY
jgi:hypothetical protein